MSLFVFAGSGSLGHTAPAIAIAQGVQQLDNTARCHFLLSDHLGEVSYNLPLFVALADTKVSPFVEQLINLVFGMLSI